MANTLTLQLELPHVLPHGWKGEVAKRLGIHHNTVTNNLKKGSGKEYDRIMKCAKELYGKPIKQEKA